MRARVLQVYNGDVTNPASPLVGLLRHDFWCAWEKAWPRPERVQEPVARMHLRHTAWLQLQHDSGRMLARRATIECCPHVLHAAVLVAAPTPTQ